MSTLLTVKQKVYGMFASPLSLDSLETIKATDRFQNELKSSIQELHKALESEKKSSTLLHDPHLKPNLTKVTEKFKNLLQSNFVISPSLFMQAGDTILQDKDSKTQTGHRAISIAIDFYQKAAESNPAPDLLPIIYLKISGAFKKQGIRKENYLKAIEFQLKATEGQNVTQEAASSILNCLNYIYYHTDSQVSSLLLQALIPSTAIGKIFYADSKNAPSLSNPLSNVYKIARLLNDNVQISKTSSQNEQTVSALYSNQLLVKQLEMLFPDIFKWVEEWVKENDHFIKPEPLPLKQDEMKEMEKLATQQFMELIKKAKKMFYKFNQDGSQAWLSACIRLVSKALKINYVNPDEVMKAGIFFTKQNNDNIAKDFYKKRITMNPPSAEAYDHAADILLKLNKSGCAYYHQIIEYQVEAAILDEKSYLENTQKNILKLCTELTDPKTNLILLQSIMPDTQCGKVMHKKQMLKSKDPSIDDKSSTLGKLAELLNKRAVSNAEIKLNSKTVAQLFHDQNLINKLQRYYPKIIPWIESQVKKQKLTIPQSFSLFSKAKLVVVYEDSNITNKLRSKILDFNLKHDGLD